MRLTVLGSGDAFSGCGCNAGYAVDGRLLVDAGAPVHVMLRRAGLDMAAVDTVLITHFHADHTFMLPILLGALMVTPGRSPTLVMAGPVGLREYVDHLVGAGYGPQMRDLVRERVGPSYIVLQDGSDEHINGYRVRAHAVVHSTGPSLAYSVSDGSGATLGFSGDSTVCAGLERVITESDLVVCECTHWEAPIPGHLWREEVAALIAAHPSTRFLVSHLTERRQLAGAVTAEDLLSLDVVGGGRSPRP
ncbi:MAG: MBL fold metallo-hydrolase [Candidatus Dormibacteria bacterium]